MNRSVRRMMCCAVAAVLVASGCGGGDAPPGAAVTTVVTTVATTAAPSTAPPTTAAPTTAAPTTTASPMAAFDAAVTEALRASADLAERRTACFTDGDPAFCFVDNDADIATAEATAVAALEVMGAAATEAGVPEDACATRVGWAAENIAEERGYLMARAMGVVTGDEPPGAPEWDYFLGLTDARIAPAGHEAALLILDCIHAVESLTGDSTLARNVGNFVFNSDVRTRPSLAFNLWTVSFCIDRPPVDDGTCLGDLGFPEPLVSHLEELGYSYEGLLEDPGYAELPATCQTAIDEATTRLQMAYEIFLDVSARELVSTDIPLLESLGQAIHLVEDQRRMAATATIYPLDEAAVVACAAAIAGVTL